MTEPTKRKIRSNATHAKVERKREDPLRFVDNKFIGDGWTVKFIESYSATLDGMTNSNIKIIRMSIGYGGHYSGKPISTIIEFEFNYDDFRNGIIQSLGMIDTLEIAKAYVKSKEGGND